ncbi:flagellar hook capping FlgD N-terminal domain-containing protein [Falsigemmobacter faecalis]|uniref:Basal-body rod modification protein FlgD n=1 Tax=Falsigemmobacter faecalis TaxID=2488730 RepID=A0A3P3D124_9RHOB|nr:flagellar hook capping FlgD N-terminal domain-containing protein [Falsigemmobacter faecalis]RRH68143.1 hypothetical protein EG244_19795 [Falsigemmobacter faecalis]
MTTINSLTSVTPTASAGTQAAVISSDFQTFLKMLTTQMQNQDPLNPMESTEFATQLATFSGVEQQVRTNAWLEQIATAGGAGGLTALSGLIGMEAELPTPARFAGSPLTLRSGLPPGAVSADLIVRDPSGQEVARQLWPQTAKELAWAGTSASGNPLPQGEYHFSLELRDASGGLREVAVTRLTGISEVRLNAEGAGLLVLSDGGEVAADAPLALRRP